MTAAALAEWQPEAAAHPPLSPVLTGQLAKLYHAGFALMPLGGEDGRTPLLQFKKKDGTPIRRHPLSVVIDRMAGAGSHNYAIRLKGMLVVDIDTDTPEANEYVARRFGVSTVQIKTRKGVHHWYRFEGQKPKDIRLPGIAIDFKAGSQDLAAGPLAERPDGAKYFALKGRLVSVSDLPKFEDRDSGGQQEDPRVNGRVAIGSRHSALKRRARQLALYANDFRELLENLIAFREWEIERPEDFADVRLEGMARWFWSKRENGELWSGKESDVLIRRTAIDELARRGEGTAFLLHAVLIADWGHRPDVPFAIVPDALIQSGRLKAGRRQIYAARDVLIDVDLLHCAQKCRGKRNHHLYRLGPDPRKDEQDKKGGGSKLILVPQKDTHPRSLSGAVAA